MASEDTLVPFVQMAQNGSRLRSGPPFGIDGVTVAAASKSKSGRILPRDVDQNPIYLPCVRQLARWHQFPAMLLTSEIGVQESNTERDESAGR